MKVMRDWMSEAANAFIARHESRFETMGIAALDTELHRLIAAHESYMDHKCITLYAGTNIINPRAAKLLASSIGSRPSLGHPGEKYNKGMTHGEQLEVMLNLLVRRLFRCDHAELRVPSGSLANLYVYMATCQPGDCIMAFSDAAAGHVTHHAAGAAGLYGLNTIEIPFDVEHMDVNLDAFAKQILEVKPKLVIIAGSMCLYPYSVSAVRDIADRVGAWVMYDAAHMGGMIAGGAFQQPLHEGAHVMTGSTYKAFGGPPSGMILSNSAELAARLDQIAFPGLTANFDLARTAAMVMATLDLLEHGPAYAMTCLANAAALAEALADKGVRVHKVAERDGFTASQHVAVQAHPYGGGDRASNVMARANILASSIGLPIATLKDDANGIRLGTQEITRWGMKPADMPDVARLMACVLERGETPEQVRPDVIALRQQFQNLHFVRLED
jgi:glycine hydroxymethyltransferase